MYHLLKLVLPDTMLHAAQVPEVLHKLNLYNASPGVQAL